MGYLGGMAIMNGFKSKETNRAEKEEAESEGRETSETSDEQSSNLSDELTKLNDLKEKGIISQEEFEKVNKGKIFCRFKGNGPPLLLLHGYPQSHVMWHKTAPELSKYFTVIVAALRGYGDSLVLPGGINHKNYSKREMAKDMVQLMS